MLASSHRKPCRGSPGGLFSELWGDWDLPAPRGESEALVLVVGSLGQLSSRRFAKG